MHPAFIRTPLLLSLIALAAANVQAQDRKTAGDDPGFVGLPTTGKIDSSRVLTERHGPQPQEPAAREPAEARSKPRKTNDDDDDDAPRKRASRPAPDDDRPPARNAFAIPSGGITGVVVESTGRGEQSKVPVTFGQVFAPGDVARGTALAAKLADGTLLPLQMDVKASHPDGSVRHAVLSTLLPRLAGKDVGIALVKAPKKAEDAGPAKPGQDVDAQVSITVDGERYTASSDALFMAQNRAQKAQVWLHGPVVTELQVASPLRNAKGAEHPHLAARFAVRWYGAAKKARVDVVVENNWAYEPDPRNITYDVELSVGGRQVYAKQGFTHWHHARWRTLAWTGEAPALHLRHDPGYLIATRAVPNYDRSVPVSGAALSELSAKWNGPASEPMGVGVAARAMPTTGGRPDIGLLPGWATMYLLSMDARAKEITLGTANLAGSWPIHYRDKRTGLPISLIDYPYMTLLGQRTDTRNPKTGKQEAFPPCPKELCKTPNIPDVAHQPGFVYLPYLVTGDHYYLEELQFWAMYNVFSSNPGYRKNIRGLLAPHQVRGQAWGLRTLGQAAYITPDGHPLKRHLTTILDSNLDWYNAEYSANPAANKLGIIVNGPAVVYRGKTSVAPWQDDFFTASVGHVAELGFKEAEALLKYKARFPIGRMVDAGACWMTAANYTYTVRSGPTAPIFDNFAQAYSATVGPEAAALPCGSDQLAAATKRKPGDMGGYSAVATGFPSNMQPALAYAAGAGGEAGRKAWALFMARSIKPDYGKGPQFSILPR
ncbi:RIFT barrel domain-containing protein [Massilia sp. SYSU DXS3249]